MNKCIINQTNVEISVTIYVAEFTKHGLRTKETHTVDIQPKDSQEVEFGNVKNSFVSGIEVSSIVNGMTITSSQKTDSSESDFSIAINQNYFIEIKNVATLEIELMV